MDKLFWTYKGYLDSVLDTQRVPGLLSRVPFWDVSVLHWSRIAIPGITQVLSPKMCIHLIKLVISFL